MGSASSSPASVPIANESLVHTRSNESKATRIAEIKLAESEQKRFELEKALWLLEDQHVETQQSVLQWQVGSALMASGMVVGSAITMVWRKRQLGAIERVTTEAAAVRRRAGLEVEAAKRRGAEALGKRLIPVCDNVDHLFGHVTELNESVGSVQSVALLEGAQLTRASLLEALESQGITRVVPEEGALFDPHVMEALYNQPSLELKPGLVASVVRPGYSLHSERILRAAQVGVSATAGEDVDSSAAAVKE